tara:strand:- start:1736 stop:1903 length:168 start_codon:yes stop_codon:yes gene_type:complete
MHMDAIPLISILVLFFAFVLVFEIIKLKKEIRKISRLTRIIQNDLNKLKTNENEK